MKLPKHLLIQIIGFWGMILIDLNISCCWAASPSLTEIHITLLGQPCLLQGPVDEATLKEVHAVGPAQLYPNISSPDDPEALTDIRKTLKRIENLIRPKTIPAENLKKPKTIPESLIPYLSKVEKRLLAQKAFLEALNNGPSTKQIDLLEAVGKKYLETNQKKFDEIIKIIKNSNKNIKSKQIKNIKINPELISDLFDAYSNGITPDPEEDFHRAISKMKVQYTCSFEENEEIDGE